MTGKEFFNSLAKGRSDIRQLLLRILEETKSDYCIVDGLAVNAYVEPVVSLDVDIVVAVKSLSTVTDAASRHGMKVAEQTHSINLSAPASGLRVQIQTDPRYQVFIERAETREVLGYRMKVASVEDVLQGKLWAYLDEARRRSKRQKDLADILRLIEAYPELSVKVPQEVRNTLT